MKNLVIILLFAFLSLPGCVKSGTELPLKFKNLELSFEKKQITKVIYTPVANGVLSILLKDKLKYSISFINYDMAHALAAKLGLQSKSHFYLLDTLFSPELPINKKSLISQIFSSSTIEKLIKQSNQSKKIFLIKHLDNTFELYISTLADDGGYYVLKGFNTEEQAKLIASKIDFSNE